MPIPPPPTTYRCPKCHWQKTTTPRSDALAPGDIYTHCPLCRHQPLETRKPDFLELALAKLKQF